MAHVEGSGTPAMTGLTCREESRSIDIPNGISEAAVGSTPLTDPVTDGLKVPPVRYVNEC